MTLNTAPFQPMSWMWTGEEKSYRDVACRCGRARPKPLNRAWELARNCAEVVVTGAIGVAVWALFSWK